MWSASHRGRIARQALRAARSDAGGFARVHSRCVLTTFRPQRRQIPLSRFLTSRRTYEGLLLTFHSWTHASLQNVRRGRLTGVRHHRQMGSPASLRSGFPHWSAVTTRARRVLTRDLSARGHSSSGGGPAAPESNPRRRVTVTMRTPELQRLTALGSILGKSRSLVTNVLHPAPRAATS